MASTQANKRWRIDYKDLPVEYMKNVLKSANYTVPKNESARSLRYMKSSLAKIDIGIMQYSIWGTADLRDFLKRRGLLVPKKETSKTALVEMLEAADYSPKFPRFMELPPEIRVMIYRHSMRSIIDGHTSDSAANYLPLEPGIVHASRLIRAEALPVFYSTKTFPLHIAATSKVNSEDGDYPQMDLHTYIFLRSVGDKYSVNFKHFTFHFHEEYEQKEAGVVFTATIHRTGNPVLDLSVAYKEERYYKDYGHLEAVDAYQYELRRCRQELEKLILDIGQLTGVKIMDWMKTFMASLIVIDQGKNDEDYEEPEDDGYDDYDDNISHSIFPLEIRVEIV